MRAHRGFSLIEMALVLMVVTLLLGGLLVPLATQVEQKRIAETQKALEEIKEALTGYALSHNATTATNGTFQPYLPCPDATQTAMLSGTNAINDGLEDRNAATGACDQNDGNLPWVTLGTAPADGWGNRFHYAVTPAFSNSTTGFGLGSSGQLTICDQSGSPCSTTPNHVTASSIPAVVVSYGKNGYGALNANGTINASPPTTNFAEVENWSVGTKNYVSTTVTAASATTTEFDDLVAWVSPNVLFNRMVAAGRLP